MQTLRQKADFCSLFRQTNFSDSSLDLTDSQGRLIYQMPVHKIILSNESEYFRRYFLSGFKNSRIDLKTTDLLPIDQELITAECLYKVLSYLYGCQIDFSDDEAVLMYRLCDYFQIDSLRRTLREQLMRLDNRRDLAQLAKELKMDQLAEVLGR